MSTTETGYFTDRYLAQRHQALERANEVRLARAELKRRIRSGELFAASVLLDPPPEAESWAVAGLLSAQYRWSAIRTRKLLYRLSIPETKPLGLLTQGQRARIAQALEGGRG